MKKNPKQTQNNQKNPTPKKEPHCAVEFIICTQIIRVPKNYYLECVKIYSISHIV